MATEAAHRPAAAGTRRSEWQGRLLPRSVIGLSVLLLATALGAAFSGAVLYAYYEYRLDRSENLAADYAEAFDVRLQTALETVEAQEATGVNAIRAEIEPLQRLTASGETVAALVEQLAPSVFFLDTLGEDGAPSVGTAFVVFRDAEQSFLLTSFEAVRAVTADPGPPIVLRRGDEELGARLVTWDDRRDLALLVVNRGNIEPLTWASGSPTVGVGDRIFAVSGLGSAGGSATQGFVSDVSGAGIQHDATVGVHFRGGPLVNSEGEVVAVASRSYAPLGFAPDDVFFAPHVRLACESVLRCPGGDAGGVGG
ncbi:MAG TPA: S1C family serine protease [Acidimicrobiales bacterium]|nr:S1C family serine protease [Acidimicrobiales bacterium]